MLFQRLVEPPNLLELTNPGQCPSGMVSKSLERAQVGSVWVQWQLRGHLKRAQDLITDQRYHDLATNTRHVDRRRVTSWISSRIGNDEHAVFSHRDRKNVISVESARSCRSDRSSCPLHAPPGSCRRSDRPAKSSPGHNLAGSKIAEPNRTSCQCCPGLASKSKCGKKRRAGHGQLPGRACALKIRRSRVA